AGPVQQSIRCLTPEAVADLDKTFSPISRTTNSTCERVEHESTPQRLKWRLQCTGQIDMDVAGGITVHSPQHYTAVITARSFMLSRLINRYARRSKASVWAIARSRLARWRATALTLRCRSQLQASAE